jgi:hypothetical protein
MTLRGLSQKSTHSGSCICDNYPIVNFICILKNTKSTKTKDSNVTSTIFFFINTTSDGNISFFI